jgi:hypothetical protein
MLHAWRAEDCVRNLVEKRERKRLLGRRKRRWEDIIKIYLGEKSRCVQVPFESG